MTKHTDLRANATKSASSCTKAHCRFCGETLRQAVVDLGMSPLCESYLNAEQLNQMEPFYPLRAYVCEKCFLVQVEQYVRPEAIFTDYAYFSSYADSWLEHCKRYSRSVAERFHLSHNSQVIEVASNDGYALQYFVELGIPAFGIEPASNVAQVAVNKGVPTLVEFFGSDCARRLADEGRKADLLFGNNVLAQVPNLNDFVEGLRLLLKPQGVITIEFPHLMCLVAGNQFDTIYHEHFSYFSFSTVEKIFAAHDLTLFDVEELLTHGGSLRIYARHSNDNSHPVTEHVPLLKQLEQEAGVNDMDASIESWAASAPARSSSGASGCRLPSPTPPPGVADEFPEAMYESRTKTLSLRVPH